MTFLRLLPHLDAGLNAVSLALLVLGLRAIRRGDRRAHPRLMVAAFSVGLLFLTGYAVQTTLAGHARFPGDDWVRTLFLLLLGSHTLLALVVAPMLLRTLYLAWRRRFTAHRRLARITGPLWLYVSTTGLIVHWMLEHLRPPS